MALGTSVGPIRPRILAQEVTLVPLFWSQKRTTIEWLAAKYRDMAMLPAAEAMRKAEAAYAADPVDAAARAGTFAGAVEGLTGQRNIDPRRVGNHGR